MMHIRGFCPMGCGQSLYLDEGFMRVVCMSLECPRDTAVDEILADPETGHLAKIGSRDFSLVHPLRERLDQDLLHCELNQYLTELGGPPVEPGRYRVTQSTAPDTWAWEDLGQE